MSIVQAVRRILELDGIPGLRILEAREADVATCFVPAKEVGEGAMEAFERGIHDHSRQIRMSLFAMPFVLLIQMQIGARLFVMSDQLLKTGIINLARDDQGI